MSTEQVTSEQQLTEFLALPARLHGRGSFVPTLERTVRRWYAGEHAQAAYGPVRLYLARNPLGQVVGRTLLHHNPAFDDTLGADLQLFGLTEFADASVLAELVVEIETQALQAGRDALLGPVGLLPNQTGGVITSGFDQRGFVDSPWNPATYPAAYASLGFSQVFEGQTWICDDFGQLDPETTFGFDQQRWGVEELEIHHASRRGLAKQLPVLRGMLNAAFAQLDYYTPISAAELADATDGLSYLLDGLRDQLALLLATRGRYRRDAILIIKGTVPGAQGQGYLTALSRELLRGLQAGGYRTLRSTFVGTDNPASAAQFVRMGGRPLHGTTFYRRDLA